MSQSIDAARMITIYPKAASLQFEFFQEVQKHQLRNSALSYCVTKQAFLVLKNYLLTLQTFPSKLFS